MTSPSDPKVKFIAVWSFHLWRTGLAAYPFGRRVDLSGALAAAHARVDSDDYTLQRQAIATLVQERSSVSLSLPTFDKAEVRPAHATWSL